MAPVRGFSSALFFPQKVTSSSPGRSVWRSLAQSPARTAAAPREACVPAGAAGAAGAAPAAQMGTSSPWWALGTPCQPVGPGDEPGHRALVPPTSSDTCKRSRPRDQSTRGRKNLDEVPACDFSPPVSAFSRHRPLPPGA